MSWYTSFIMFARRRKNHPSRDEIGLGNVKSEILIVKRLEEEKEKKNYFKVGYIT